MFLQTQLQWKTVVASYRAQVKWRVYWKTKRNNNRTYFGAARITRIRGRNLLEIVTFTGAVVNIYWKSSSDISNLPTASERMQRLRMRLIYFTEHLSKKEVSFILLPPTLITRRLEVSRFALQSGLSDGAILRRRASMDLRK